jgi:hypothetical protein
VEVGDAACGFWCMVVRWCTRTSLSELAVAMVAWLSASMETKGREEANVGNGSELGWLWRLPRWTRGLLIGVQPPGGGHDLVLSATEPRPRWPSGSPSVSDSPIWMFISS